MNAKEKIVEELPIKEMYEDLLQPSARKLGKTAEDILKFVSLPFSFLGMTADELEEKYREFITNALRKVPEDKREKPSPLVAAPLLEHIKLLFNDEKEKTLEQMFCELLKNSCDKNTKKYVQPSYVYTLKQLTWVEANLLRLLFDLSDECDCLGAVFKKLYDISDSSIKVLSTEAEPLEDYCNEDYSNVFFECYFAVLNDKLQISAEELRMSLNMLEQLNLVKRLTINKYKNKNEYSLEKHDMIHVEEFDPYKKLEGFSLTGYALDMMQLCVSNEQDEES